MESLRNELIETQKVRTDLIKWKLILVSTLGAAALGFTKIDSKINTEILLCCIPFVCAYTDMQYTNLALRISGIATFIRKIPIQQNHESIYIKNYEIFMNEVRLKIQANVKSLGEYSLQTLVMLGSSLLFSISIGVYGLKDLFPIRFGPPIYMSLAGVIGFALTVWISCDWKKRNRIIKGVGDTFLFAEDSFFNKISSVSPSDIP